MTLGIDADQAVGDVRIEHGLLGALLIGLVAGLGHHARAGFGHYLAFTGDEYVEVDFLLGRIGRIGQIGQIVHLVACACEEEAGAEDPE